MQVAKPGGTREQTAVAEWLDRAELVRGRLAGVTEQAPSLVTCFDAWSSAVAQFGECELHARALDRSRALDVFEDRRSALSALVKERNEGGIADIERVRELLPRFGKELGALDVDADRTAEVLDRLERTVREHLADWEMKGTDAERLMRQFTEFGDVVRSSGPQALGDHLDRTFDQLIAARREPDRGNRENIPFWKLIILAGMVGWYIAFIIIAAVYRGDQHLLIFTAYGIIQVIHFVAFVLFC
jgi:hypothetical protein